MYALRPPYVAVLDEVLQDPLMKARADGMLAVLPPETPLQVISQDEIPELSIRHDWAHARQRMGATTDLSDPALFFGVMRFDNAWDHTAVVEGHPGAGGPLQCAYGYDAFRWFDSHMSMIAPCPDHICRPAWRIHLTNGCPHHCCYCSLGALITVMMNVEEYVDHLDQLVKANPWEKTYLFEDDSEALALEPEYGAVPALAEYFATTDEYYLLIHSKSANVDFFADVSPAGREHTIIVWSLTTQTQSTVLEPGAATMAERIEAARKCDEMGICTRYKYKPIIPTRNWRDEIAQMTRMVFERSNPDLIALFTLAWMSCDDMLKIIDEDLLDPVYLQAARDRAEEMKDLKVKPFPHWVRKEIYEFCIDEIRKHNREIPIVLCTETAQMWDELGPIVGYRPQDYPCGCGPQATPWLARLPESPWRIAKPVGVEGYPAPY